MVNAKSDGGLLPCSDAKTRQWKAWNNLQPPLPNTFHLIGEVQVPNPGVEVLLVPSEPQGVNPEILLMDLLLIQRPGSWPQAEIWAQGRYDKPIGATGYTDVDIRCAGESLAMVDVQNVH